MRRRAACVRRSPRVFALLLVGAALACDSRRPLESRGAPPQSLGWSRPPEATAKRRPDAGAPEPRRPRSERRAEAPAEPEHSSALDATDAAGSVSGPFIIDGLVDVAPAGPIAATERGVAMYDRDNRLQLARLEGPLEAAPEPRETRVTPLPDEAGPFTLARGPVIRRGLAYWVSRGRLLGQSLASAGAGDPLVLAEDARVGTRAAVPVGPSRQLQDIPQVAAYIARPTEPDGPATAKLWVEGHNTGFGLTDDLSSGHSVALAATSRGLQAIFLEARTGMSSIHLRALTFSKKHEPVLGADHIVWVGGPARPTTELFTLPSAEPRVLGFLTLERDITHFGLVSVDVPLAPGTEFPIEPEWRLYDNGIEPSPFALAEVCGRSVVALARPSSPVPHAVQELVLIDLAADARTPPALVARSRAFFDISLGSASGGALLAYVADHRTWVRSIRCARP
ncbi:MAG TPA: hypothetical protein VMG12_35795 [Polyangiaceae bacterium]|nr:hypothetical protein [Polyangiaceae bacterium]